MKQLQTLHQRLLIPLLGLMIMIGLSLNSQGQTFQWESPTLSPVSGNLGAFSAPPPPPEICNNGIDDDGDGLIDFFDPDCPQTNNYYGLPTPSCNGDLSQTDFTIAAEYLTSNSTRVAVYSTPVAADIDGDGIVELLVMANDSITIASGRATKNIRVFNGATGALEQTIITPYMGWSSTSSLGIADVDGDGLGEVFILTSGSSINADPADRGVLICYENDGTLKWKSNSIAGYVQLDFNSSVNFADFNGDGIAEVYTYSKIFNSQTGVLLAEGGTSNNVGRSSLVSSLGNAGNSFAADIIPGNSGLELVVGNQVFTVDITNTTGTAGNTMQVATTAQNAAADGFTAVADMDLDGDLDVISTKLDGGNSVLLTIYDGQTDALLAPIFTIPSSTLVGIHTVGDIDGDCAPEILIVTSLHLRAFELNSGAIVQKWDLATSDGSGATGQTLFDFNQDGLIEIVYRDESNIRILEGATGNNLATFACRSGTGWENPIVVDTDNDNQAEIVVTCGTSGSGTQGVLVVYGTGGDPWAPARSVWSQKSYQPVAVNDDLSIPISQQDHSFALSNSSCGCNGVNRPLNNFVVQSTFLDGQGCPLNPVSDVVLNLDSVLCTSPTTVEVFFTVSNPGSFDFVAGGPVAFYHGNPTTSSAALLDTVQLSSGIAVGQSASASHVLNVGSLSVPSTLFAIANDNGIASTPFSLINDFPVTSVGECDYTNNLDSLIFNGCCPASLGITGTTADEGCPAANDGSIDLSVAGGLAPYQFLWNDNTTTEDRSGLAPGTYSVTVIDANGCTDQANFTINSGMDITAPTAICQSFAVALDANGLATISASDIDAGSFDDCGTVSLSLSNIEFDCQDVGTNQVTLTVTDLRGNSSTCSAQVTIEDTIAPNAVCQNTTVFLDNSGLALVSASDIDGGSSDVCGISAISTNPLAYGCGNVGINTAVLSVSDVNGNSATCTAQISVVDSIPPSVNCLDTVVFLDVTGNVDVDASTLVTNLSDNCGSVVCSWDSLTTLHLDCNDVGISPQIVTVSDVNGNASTCTSNITVIDNIAPIALCQDITVQLDASGTTVVDASDIDAGSADNCDFALGTSNNVFDCSDVDNGGRPLVLTAIDASGNTASCTAQVTAVDTTNSICCPLPFDFEADSAGNNLSAGTIINSQFASMGVLISADNNNGPDVALIFDSNNPSGGDMDLGTPNQQYAGPGIGGGGATNDMPEGKILIIAEDVVDNNNDGLVDNPDDDANGGRLVFEFTDRAVSIETVRLIDLDDGPWSIVLELDSGGVTTIPVPTLGDNSAYTVPVYTSDVQRMIVEIGGSGAVAGFTWCPDGALIVNNPRSANAIGIPAGSSLEYSNELEVFPNPFMEGTQLRFRMGTSTEVSLKVYDLQGVEVRTLFEGEVMENKVQTVGFQPKELARGIYFARLSSTDGHLLVKKLIYK